MPAYPLDVDEWMRHPGCTRDDLSAVARLMADFPHPWYFCGGWAIDLFLGQPMRTHKDVDIGIFHADQLVMQSYLMERDWELATAESGVLAHWQPGEWLELPYNTIWCRNPDFVPPHLEVLFDRGDMSEFHFRRNPVITCPGTKAICRNVDGLPYLAPEIALLYKSAHVELVENLADFDHALPHLTAERRAWLRDGLTIQYGDHLWLEKLGDR